MIRVRYDKEFLCPCHPWSIADTKDVYQFDYFKTPLGYIPWVAKYVLRKLRILKEKEHDVYTIRIPQKD